MLYMKTINHTKLEVELVIKDQSFNGTATVLWELESENDQFSVKIPIQTLLISYLDKDELKSFSVAIKSPEDVDTSIDMGEIRREYSLSPISLIHDSNNAYTLVKFFWN